MPTIAAKKINRTSFFKQVKDVFFHGRLSQSQVDGLSAIIDEWENRGLTDLRWLSYVLATVHHECAGTFQPIKEYGNDAYFNRRYGPQTNVGKVLGNIHEGDGARYAGMGFAQITGRNNYAKFGIADHPEMALEPTTATNILFDGMIKGIFTGRKLADYFREGKTDWLNARRIINGNDQALKIASYAASFYKILS